MSIDIKEIELESYGSGKIHLLRITGKLDKADYELFVPPIEAGIEKHGKVNILIELADFHGWTAGAMWEDTKFGVKHFNDIDKLAVVGDQNWEKNLATFAKVFTRAEVRYFDHADNEAAHRWVAAV